MSSKNKNGIIATRSAKKTAKHARAASKRLSGRAARLVKNNPLRVLLGAVAMAVVAVKLKQRFA